jgi:hypothetical protein
LRFASGYRRQQNRGVRDSSGRGKKTMPTKRIRKEIDKMNYKAVQDGDSIRASVNGVVSTALARRCTDGWAIMIPQIAYSVPTKEEAIRRIAKAMGKWYTSDQAAIRLVELNVYDKTPSRQTITRLCQAGAFPGAFKLLGKGKRAVGSGGQWRIPEDGVMEYARRMKR